MPTASCPVYLFTPTLPTLLPFPLSEIFERRYPVLLRQFSVRKGSGGEGRYTGGDGVIREIEFTRVSGERVVGYGRGMWVWLYVDMAAVGS